MSSWTDLAPRTSVVREPVAALGAPWAELHEPGTVELVDAITEEVRAAAYAEGHAAGFEAGRAEALADAARAADEHRRRFSAVLDALTGAATALRQREAVALDALADTVLYAALELARAVVGRELAVASDPGRDALARALRLTPPLSSVTARLHPDDVARLGDVAHLAAGRSVTIVADPSVEPGGCVAEAGDLRVDAQLSGALDRAREALSCTR